MIKLPIDPRKLADLLEAVASKHVCSYVNLNNEKGDPKLGFCDCKYGATPKTMGSGHEVGCGCPEMREIIHLLRVIPKHEFKKYMKIPRKR